MSGRVVGSFPGRVFLDYSFRRSGEEGPLRPSGSIVLGIAGSQFGGLPNIRHTAFDPESGLFVVFYTTRLEEKQSELYVQRFRTTTGEPFGDPIQVTSDSDGRDPGPAQAVWLDRLASWVLVYQCFEAEGSNTDGDTEICGQRLNSAFAPIGETTELSDVDDGKDSTDPHLLLDPDGDPVLFHFDELEEIVAKQLDGATLAVESAVSTPLLRDALLADNLQLGCPQDLGSADLGASFDCTGPPVAVLTMEGFGNSFEGCSERSGVIIGLGDWETLEFDLILGAGPECDQYPGLFVNRVDLAIDPWSQTGGILYCLGARRFGNGLFCEKRSFAVPEGNAVQFSEPLLLGAATGGSVVPLSRRAGFGSTVILGDLLVILEDVDDQGTTELFSFGLTVPCVDGDQTTCLSGDQIRLFSSFNTAAGSNVSAEPCFAGGSCREMTAVRSVNDAGSAAHTVEITGDTGYLWFFDDDNVEVVVKVLDACVINSHFWVFSAGLTNVAVDLVLKAPDGSAKEYRNPLGRAYRPTFDTEAFECSAEQIRVARERAFVDPFAGIDEAVERLIAAAELSGASAGELRWATAAAAGAPCQSSGRTLCLTADRFQVRASFETPDGTSDRARTVELTADTGYLWFFDEDNVEAVLKVLDACVLNDHFWVFAAGLTNVEVTITITDTVTGAVRTLSNPQGTDFAPIQDTMAFPCSG